MKLKLLFLSSILLLACDPIGRMTGNYKHPEEQVQQPAAPVRYEGDLRHANYVEIPLTDASKLKVYLKHKGSWILLDEIDEMNKGKDPYYLISTNLESKTIVVFQNETYTDLYSIEVTN